jgi:hypothetical protein
MRNSEARSSPPHQDLRGCRAILAIAWAAVAKARGGTSFAALLNDHVMEEIKNERSYRESRDS